MEHATEKERFDMDAEIDLIALWKLLWREKLIILGLTVVFVILAIVFSYRMDEIFRSETLLSPISAGQSISPAMSQFGAVAGLAGINIPNTNNSKVGTALASLQSREFIRKFIERHNILSDLFASKRNKDDTANVIDAQTFNSETGVWRNGAPSESEAYTLFRGILQVAENQANGLITVAIEWTSPRQAQQWVTWLVEDINAQSKAEDLEEALSSIEYLKNQLQATQLVEMQRVFYQLIESQTQVVMLADVRDEYLFRVIDPAFLPEKKIRPNRTIMVLLAAMIGAALGIAGVLVRHTFSNPKHLLTEPVATS